MTCVGVVELGNVLWRVMVPAFLADEVDIGFAEVQDHLVVDIERHERLLTTFDAFVLVHVIVFRGCFVLFLCGD